MPHKRSRGKEARLLVDRESVDDKLASFSPQNRSNIVSRMSANAKQEVVTLIGDRYNSVEKITDSIATRMNENEKQYQGEWLEPNEDSEEDIYIPKTRELLETIHAYILSLVSQLKPIVTVQPKISNLAHAREQYQNAKLLEAMLQYYFDDVWNIRTDIFPIWLKKFLKHPLSVAKISYFEDNFKPDLKIENIDRAFLYIDAYAKDLTDARWLIERYYLPRAEVEERIKQGHWKLSPGDMGLLEGGIDTSSSANAETLARIYGQTNFLNGESNIIEDDLIEIWDYWQAPIGGLVDVYAVVIGGREGALARYGRNPFPYKGIPYRGKAFDPKEDSVDGVSFVEQYSPMQQAINQIYNLRFKDVRKNIISPVMVLHDAVDEQTQQDMADGHKLVRASAAITARLKDNPNEKLADMFVPLPISTSTQELLVGDLPAILGLGKEASHITDVFQGQAPQGRNTLGQIQEQLSRSQGAFRPIYLSVMRWFEEIAEICFMYFKDEDFYSEERIISIIGETHYRDIIDKFTNVGGETFSTAVSADDLDIDVTFNAVNQADQLASKTFMLSSLEQIFQSIGQIPELYQDARKKINFSAVFDDMFFKAGFDAEAFRFTPEQMEEEKQQQAIQQQQAEQQRQQAMQEQLAFQSQLELGKQQAIAQGKIAIDDNHTTNSVQADTAKSTIQNTLDIGRDEAKTNNELVADLVRMQREFILEMRGAVDVGHGNNINQSKQTP